MIWETVKSPQVYSEWVVLLDILKAKEDDDMVIQVLQKGRIEWQTGVLERFTRRVTDAINTRINAATDRFQRDYSKAYGHEGKIVHALLALRKELLFLIQITDLLAIPDEYKKQYRQLIIDQADQIQASLENSAKTDRSGKQASIVRNHKINTFKKEMKANE